MSGILEKITLYDILGYFFPGCFFMLMLAFGYREETLRIMGEWSGHETFLRFAFLLAAYLVGIALSEITQWGHLLFQKIRDRICKDTCGIEMATEALVKSRICQNEQEVRDTIARDSGRRYMRKMYGMIQNGAEYKRIHNYASAFVLYKNMAGAIIMGELFWRIYGADIARRWFVCGIFASVLLVVRSYRFACKKDEYTVAFFMDKFR